MLAANLGPWPTLIFHPTTIEFDLVFPRNETYAADALLPIVVAIQNPQEVGLLGFSIGYSIFWRGINASNNDVASGYQHSLWANYSTVGNEPYFETFYTDALNGTEGQFTIVIDLNTRNCTLTDSSLNFGQVTTYATLDFELRNGAQRPSIITPKDSCPVGIASFDITDTIPQSTSNVLRDFCAVMADPAPKMNPCAVKINSTVASNISTSIAASACTAGLLLSDCPLPDNKSNTAAQLGMGSKGWSGVVAGLFLCVTFVCFS